MSAEAKEVNVDWTGVSFIRKAAGLGAGAVGGRRCCDAVSVKARQGGHERR